MTWDVSIFNTSHNWNFQDRRKVLLSSLTDQLKQVLARTVMMVADWTKTMSCATKLEGVTEWHAVKLSTSPPDRIYLFCAGSMILLRRIEIGSSSRHCGKDERRSVFNSYHAVIQWYCILSSQSAKLEKPHDRPFWQASKTRSTR